MKFIGYRTLMVNGLKAIARCPLAALPIVMALPATGYGLEVFNTPEVTLKINASHPLAGLYQVVADENVRVSLLLDDGTEKQQIDFQTVAASQSLPILGLRPDKSYSATATLYGESGASLVLDPVEFQTEALPPEFPAITKLISVPEKMEPGYTLFYGRNLEVGQSGYQVIVDKFGDVVWFARQNGHDFRMLPDGNLMWIRGCVGINHGDLLGNEVASWYPATHPDSPECYQTANATPVQASRFHHEAYPTPHDTILVLTEETRTVEDYPTSTTDPNAPTGAQEAFDNPIIEFDMQGQILNQWSLMDLLDPTRVSHDGIAYNEGNINDWPHANAVIWDKRDNSIIISIRNQDAIIKVDHTTGQLKWILGPHANWKTEFLPYLLAPVGENFEWQYKQHAPQVTPDGTILMFDNGTYRASAFEPILPESEVKSRAIEYRVNENTMEVELVWEYGSNVSNPIFSRWIGDADWQPITENVLITFGTNNNSPKSARLIEVTHETPAEPVFDIGVGSPISGVAGWTVYRAERLPSLYHESVATQMLILETGTEGKPDYSVGVDRGFYLWREGDQWQLRWTGNGTDQNFGGEILSEEGITSIAPVQLEAGEDSWSQDGNKLIFSGVSGSGEDGINFIVPAGGDLKLNFSIDGKPAPAHVLQVGGGATPGISMPILIDSGLGLPPGC